MAKRYGIFPIIGDGTIDDPYRSAASDVAGVNMQSAIPTDQQGAPVWNFAYTICGTLNLTALKQVTNSFVFPEYPLDGELSGMESGIRTAMKQSVEAYDMDGQGHHLSVDLSDLSASYRGVLLSIYQQIDPLFTSSDFDRFDTAEPNE